MSLFIVIEGIECSGKTTQLVRIAHALRGRGYIVNETREPGGSDIGEQIRKIVKDSHYQGTIDPLTSLFLFSASRRQFVKEVVLPALKRGEIVLADRSYLSTIVFQGYAEGIDITFVREVCKRTNEDVLPDKIFLLDITTQEMKRRMTDRIIVGGDRYDAMDVSFHDKVRDGYLAEQKKDPDHIEIVDAHGSVDAVTADILQRVEALLS